MVDIVINNESIIPLIGNFNPVNFYYNISEKRFDKYEGELIFKDIEFKGEITTIKTFKLIGKYGSLSLNDFKSSFIKKNENSIKINLKFSNIFEVFERTTEFFNKEFEPSKQTYDCYSTSMNCNLSCEYCVYGCNNHKKYLFHHPIIHNSYVNKIRHIINKVCNPMFNVIRIMGGETLIDINDFHTILNHVKNNYDKIDDIWIYTNLTINVEKFINIINKFKTEDKIKKITIIFTSDSLDERISNRIHNKSTMETYINNIRSVINEYKNDSKILIASNLMYINHNDTFTTACKLYDYGVQYIQISYDEFSSYDRSLVIKEDITKVYDSIEYLGIKRLKPNLGKVMWYHFFIDIGNDNVFQCKFSFKSNYVISKLNNY